MKGTNYNIYISVLHIDILQEVAKQDRKYRKPTINSIKIGIIMKFLVCYTTIDMAKMANDSLINAQH